jgi:hypothetical protein
MGQFLGMVLQFWESECLLCSLVCDLMSFAMSSPLEYKGWVCRCRHGWLLLVRHEPYPFLVMSLIHLVQYECCMCVAELSRLRVYKQIYH